VVSGIFFLGYFIMFIFDFFQRSYAYSSVAEFLYIAGGLAILSAIFGGPVVERAYTFPFPLDAVYNNVPKIFERNRRRLYGRVVNRDQSSNTYVVRIGWLLASIMTVNLSKVDESKTIVHARYEGKFFIGFGSGRILDVFFGLLHSSLIT